MENLGLEILLGFLQVFFAVVLALCFWNSFRGHPESPVVKGNEAKQELEKLKEMRAVSLTVPLTERTRPQNFSEIIGQAEGLKALRAALCSPHPQHVLIYGPPGVGKTAAARLVLEEAKRLLFSPFGKEAKFIEIDGATARFDERGIADPLIGSVHDPIYQGAGPLGLAGIPQPKPGAVTKAHGGVLFVDEIGELHPFQINKLLKVLEDRKVMLESAYYHRDDPRIPAYIHDIFQNGLPADFRLVGATTRTPSEIPAAIRSRCLEIFFRELLPEEIGIIAQNAALKIGLPLTQEALALVVKYAESGRAAVNMVQLAAGLVALEGRREITGVDLAWIVTNGQYQPRPVAGIPGEPRVGIVNGLAVYGPNLGVLFPVEVRAFPVKKREGRLIITGVVEAEELHAAGGKKVSCKGAARAAVETAFTVLQSYSLLDPRRCYLHVSFPGSLPVDGPSAGAAVAVATYSAVTGIPVDNTFAVTGEISVQGEVRAVGGIIPKLEAARRAGAKKVCIPQANWQESFCFYPGLKVFPARYWEEILREALLFSFSPPQNLKGAGEAVAGRKPFGVE